MRTTYKALAIISFVLASGAVANLSVGQETSQADKLIDSAGNLKMPPNYQTTYQFLGTWAVGADEGAGSKQLHNVYVSPGGIEAFRKNGEFPDGSVLVKEVFAAKNDQMTTGTVSHADKLQGWFLMIKESKNTHPENKLWGDGWVWSWFDAGKPNKTTTTDYKAECKGCHVPAQATDWVYSSGYPPLKK
jgi:hypothetical protein